MSRIKNDLIKDTENKYILTEVISQYARIIKKRDNIDIGYKAINKAIDYYLEGKIFYDEAD